MGAWSHNPSPIVLVECGRNSVRQDHQCGPKLLPECLNFEKSHKSLGDPNYCLSPEDRANAHRQYRFSE